MNKNVFGIFFLFVAFNFNVNANDCLPVIQLPKGHFDRGGYIERLGKYCLTYDIYQPKKSRWGWESGNSFGGNLISFQIDHQHKDVYDGLRVLPNEDRKSTRLNSSHQ